MPRGYPGGPPTPHRLLVKDIRTLRRRQQHLEKALANEEVLQHMLNFVRAEEAALRRAIILMEREEQCLRTTP